MKQVGIIIIIITLFLQGCQVKIVHEDRLSARNGVYYEEDLSTPFTGKAIHTFLSGKKQMEANFINGIPHGHWYTWQENGTLIREFEYENGQITKFATYCINGQKLLYAEYENEKQHGKNILWFKNGKKKFKVDFKNGVKHGKDLRWHENGQLASETEYINGEKTEATYWDKDGIVIKTFEK